MASEPERQPRSQPDRIGRYVVERLLGTGTFATVWLAFDEALQARVAVKVLADNWSQDLHVRARFVEEARILWRADHDRVVRVHLVDELDDGRPYFVMDWADRGSLEHRIASRRPRGGFSLEEAVALGCEIAESLQVVHDLGFIHRDLKPSNVLFRSLPAHRSVLHHADTESQVRELTLLADFGLAKQLSLASGITLGAGTPAYMAPEQVGVTSDLDERVDIYALAVVVHELLFGRAPGDHPSSRSRLAPVLVDRSDLPPGLRGVLDKGLDPDPDRRFRTARQLGEALRAVVDPGGGSPPRRAAPGRRRVLAPLPPPLQLASPFPLVGRHEERRRFLGWLSEAVAGRQQLVLLSGDVGIGKTHLARELAMAAYREGATVLWGRCREELGAPYQPFVEALGHHVAACSTRELRALVRVHGGELARLVPELGRRVPEALAERPSGDEGARHRLFEAVTSLLGAAARSRPVVMVLDDLHWARKPELLMLKHVMTSTEPMALVMLGTYRDTELTRSHPLAGVTGDLHGEQIVRRLPLEGLSEEEVTSLVRTAVSHDLDHAGHQLARAVWQESSGSPFFVVELLRDLTDSGALLTGIGPETFRGDVTSLGIPESVREVIGRRVGRLSPGADRALRLASVIGPDFELKVLSRLSSRGDEETLASLEEAVSAGLLTESGTALGRFSFPYAHVRNTLYEQIGGTRRAYLHRRTAEALEELSAADSQDRLAGLAHHWFESADAAGDVHAAGYSRQAGDRAQRHLAFEEASGHYARALQALGPDEPETAAIRCHLLLALGESQRHAGDVGFRSTLAEAAGRARSVGDVWAMARAALGSSRLNAWFTEAGRVDHDLVALHEEVLATLDEDDGLRARLLANLAAELYWAPDRDRCRALCDEALGLAREVDDPAELARVLASRLVALWDPTTVDDHLAVCDELNSLAVELDTPELAFQSCLFRLIGLLEAGDRERAEDELTVATRLSAALRQPLYTWLTKTLKTMGSMLGGRPEAEAEIFANFERGQSCGQPDAPLVMAVQLFTLRWDQGRIGELLEQVESLVEQLGTIPAWRAALALAYGETGRSADARTQFELMAGNGFDLPFDLAWLTGMTMLAETCAILGDRRRAADLYVRLLPFADHVVVVGNGISCLGSVARALGLVASTMGRLADAEGHFQAALVANRRLGAASFVVRTQRGLAAMLVESDRPGDRERASSLVEEGLGAAQELGMGREVERLLALQAPRGCG